MMNDLTSISKPMIDKEICAALVSLAMQQRRQAHQYRAWAIESEIAGNIEHFRKWRALASQYWRDAKWHLKRARSFQH